MKTETKKNECSKMLRLTFCTVHRKLGKWLEEGLKQGTSLQGIVSWETEVDDFLTRIWAQAKVEISAH